MIKSKRSKRLKKTKTNTKKSKNNNYPPLPTISSYFSPPSTLTKSPTPSSILIKKYNNLVKSIRLKLNKKKQKDKYQYHQQNNVITSPIILRPTEEHNSSKNSFFKDKNNNSSEHTSDSSSSYCLLSTSELSTYQNIFIPNLAHELKSLTPIHLQSPSNSSHSSTQNEFQKYPTPIYPSITIPLGIAKNIHLD